MRKNWIAFVVLSLALKAQPLTIGSQGYLFAGGKYTTVNNQQVMISDIYVDDRIPHEAYRPTGIHSLVMTPVGDTEPFGALGAYWAEVREITPGESSSMAARCSACGREPGCCKRVASNVAAARASLGEAWPYSTFTACCMRCT